MNDYILQPLVEARRAEFEREVQHLRRVREALAAARAARTVPVRRPARRRLPDRTTGGVDEFGRPPWQRQT